MHHLDLPCPPATAFELFTGMTWWDPAYSPDESTFGGITVEPYVGGSVSMKVGEDSYPWGSVTAWDPGFRYGQTFWLSMDPANPSCLDVTFGLASDGSHVRFEHGGWTELNGAARDKFGDWPRLLARYADLVGRDHAQA